ncbi:MAG TPA: T9SS type A sorting domain-containing protein [Prolixibacteraceae bacterium]|nr:T9SS type A sorting domain-containing protein [Lentimicrobium sp.]HLN73061.1 T9SS type A sorting domain-containing protein [Prolixibacteraceae bacterium]
MKRNLLVFSMLVLLAFSVKAQIVVDRTDFPHTGDLVVTAVDETTHVSPGNAGANQTWDFHNLIATGYDSALFIPVNQAPNWQNFPLANMASQTLDPGTGYAYGFYHDSGDDIGIAGMQVMGELMPGFNIVMSARYLTESWFRLPYHYGDNRSCSYMQDAHAGMYNNGSLIDSSKVVSDVDVQMLVDAWGTMVTPTGSFQVLRVKETKNWVDSSYSWTGTSWQFEGAENFNSTGYKFYGKNYGLIGEIAPNEQRENGMMFFVSETIVNTNNLEIAGQASVYPNPANGQITVDAGDITRIEIFSASGQLEMVSTSPKLIDVSRLGTGLHIIKVYTSDNVIDSKFIKR